MTPPADLALITDDAPFFARAVNESEPRQWRLRDCRLIMLPLHCKTGKKALLRGLGTAWYAGCRIAALPPAMRRGLSAAPLQLADGRLFALSALPRRLDVDCPGWRSETVGFNADDNFSCLAARLLAPYSARIHIFGEDEARRQALIRLLYRESGLIVSHDLEPRQDSLIILPPSQVQIPASGGAQLWQDWPQQAVAKESNIISSHLAEALLLSAGELPQNITPLILLRLLNHRGLYHEILPL